MSEVSTALLEHIANSSEYDGTCRGLAQEALRARATIERMTGLHEAGKGARVAIAGVDQGETRFEHPNAQDTYDAIWALKNTIGALTRQLHELIDPSRSAPATIPAPPPTGPESGEPGE